MKDRFDTTGITKLHFHELVAEVHERINDGWVLQGSPFSHDGRFYVIICRRVDTNISDIVPGKD